MNQPLTRVRNRTRANLTQTVALSAVSLFIVIIVAFLLKDPLLARFDTSVGESFRSIRNSQLSAAAKVFDWIGSTTGYAVITLMLAFLFAARRRLASTLFTIVSVAGVYALNTVIKERVERPRPALEQLFAADGFSFPSGNATISVALLGFAAAALPVVFPRVQKRWSKWITAASLLLIVLIGLFRIYSGVHYPSDIIAGYFLGAAWLFIVIHLHQVYAS